MRSRRGIYWDKIGVIIKSSTKQATELEVISLVHVTSFQVSLQVLPLTKYHWPYLLFHLFLDFRLFVFDGLVNYLSNLLS